MARRGENIRKRSDGRWEGRYIKGRADGKAIWGYLYGYSYSEVKTELTRRKAMSGFYQLSGASMRFSELAELWLASFAQGVKESTLTHYQYTLHKYLLPVLGDLPVSELNESTLERLFLQILSPSEQPQAVGNILCARMLRDVEAYLQICGTPPSDAAS